MKKILGLLLAVCIIMQTIMPFSVIADENINITEEVTASSSTSLQKGEYLYFGKYNGSPVKYIVAGKQDVNGDGKDEILIITDKIIMRKNYSVDNYAIWSESTLRTYLNSNDKKVNYPDGKAPDADWMTNSVANMASDHKHDQYAWDNEAGFLTNLSDFERNQIVPVTHKAIVHKDDLNRLGEGNWGGTEGHNWHGSNSSSAWWGKWFAASEQGWKHAYTNYDGGTDKNGVEHGVAYHQLTKDYCFIPSIKDVYDFNIAINLPGNSIDLAYSNGASAYKKEAGGYTWYRDASGPDGSPKKMFVRYYAGNDVRSTNNQAFMNGVRPMFFIKSDIPLSGSGTEESPYVINEPYKLSATLNGEANVTTIPSGENTVSFTVTGSISGAVANIAVLKIENGVETVKYLDSKALTTNTDSFTVEVDEADYIKLFLTDASGKDLRCAPYVFGKEEKYEISDATASVNTIYLDEPKVSDGVVTITGATGAERFSYVTLEFKKDSNGGVAYKNQVIADENGAFSLNFKVSELFGVLDSEKDKIGGWYTLTVSSSEAATATKRVGVSDESILLDVIDIFNDKDVEKIGKILANDESYILEYSALPKNDMILADVAAEKISSLAQYIADTIPEEGYTKDTFASVFNKSAAAFLLINEEDIAKKYKILENTKYKGILGSEEFTNKSYYKELKEAKADVFELLSVNAVDDIIENAIMYLANNAESPEDLMEIVELESDAIGVELDDDYDKVKNYADILQDMYFNMMVTFDNYDDIVSAFNSAKATALTKVAEKQNQTVSNNTSSNKGSSSSGRVIKITKPQVTEDKEDKEEVVITPSKKAPFTDIDDLSYGIDAINRLYQDGVISGDGDGLFRPYDTVKREEFTKMLSSAFDIISDTEIAFSDVNKDMWYYAYIKNLYGAGIIKGTSENTFGIGENLTRQDLAVMLYRFLNEESKANKEVKFNDDNAISDYAKEAVYALNHIGIVNGYNDNTFNPLKLATRQETAQLIWKVKNYIEYGNQEAFSVENQNKKPEHYDFLESLGIKVDTEKTFDDSISKSEFVYLIMKALNIGNVSYSDAELIFRDVKADYWAYNEITAAAKLGIVKGYVDDAFGINDFVASDDAAIMAMRAIGFSSALTEAELIANFSTIYNDILDGVNKNSQITLADAYTLIFNMLNSKYPSDDVIGTDEIVLSIQKDSIFMEKAFDIYKYTGRVEANQFSSVGITTKVLGKNQVQIDGFVYSSEVDTADFIGLSVEYFVKKEGSQQKIIYMVSYEDALDQITIQDAFLTDVQKDGNEIIVYYENAANKEKTERFPLNAAVIYNGSATSFKIAYIKDLIDGGKCGSVTIIDDNGNYIVRIDSYKTEVVKTISTYDSKIVFESGNEIEFADDDFEKHIAVSRNGEKCEILDLARYDVALVKESIDGNVVIIEADNWAIDGTVTGYSAEDDFVEINNAQYVMSNSFAKNTTLALGEKAKFYFDIFGNVAYMDDKSVVYDEQYGFLVNIASLLDLGKGYTMSVYTLDGEIKTYELLEEVKFNSSTTKKKAEDLAKDFDDGKIPNQMVYFKQNGDGFITTIGTAQTGSNILSLDIPSVQRRYLKPFFANGTAETDLPLFYVDNDTVMIMAPATDADQADFEDEKNYETQSALAFFDDYQQYVVEAYNLNDFNVAKFVILRDETSSGEEPSGATQMVVTNTVVMVDEEGEMQNVIRGVTGSGEVTLVLKEDELGFYQDASSNTKAIKRGDIIKYALNNKGICNYTKHTGSIDAIDRTGGYSGKTNSDNFLASGTVIDSEGTYLKIAFGDGTQTVLYGLTNMTPIICDSKNDRIFAGSLSDIQSGDFVYTRSRYSYLQEIIVVK